MIIHCYISIFKDPYKEVKELANFLEIPLSHEKISEIVEKTSLKKMKKSNEDLETKAMRWFRDTNLGKG